MEKVYFPLDTTTGQHKNHGFVEFEHKDSVPYSILLLNGVCLCGRPLRVGTVGKVSAATTATAASAVFPSTGAPDCTEGTADGTITYDEIELQAAILAAQIQLGMTLPVLSDALLDQAGCPPVTPNVLNPLFSSTNNVSGQGLLPPVAAGPTPLFGVPLSTANDTTNQTLSPPLVPSGPTPLHLFACTPTNGDIHPTLGQRLSPPPLHPGDPTPLFNCVPLPSNDDPMQGQSLSPTLPPNGPIPLFSCNLSPWEQDCVTNGNDSNLWEKPSNHNDHSRKEPPNRDHSSSWEQLPKQEQLSEEPSSRDTTRVANSDEIYLSPSPPWNSLSPPRHLTDEHGFHSDPVSPWEQPPNGSDDVPDSLRFRLSPRHDHTSNHSERDDYATSHPDDAMSTEPHPYNSDHTLLHRSRVLHSDDKPSWVTEDTKEQIRDHHLSKLSETLVRYQQLYSKQGSI